MHYRLVSISITLAYPVIDKIINHFNPIIIYKPLNSVYDDQLFFCQKAANFSISTFQLADTLWGTIKSASIRWDWKQLKILLPFPVRYYFKQLKIYVLLVVEPVVGCEVSVLFAPSVALTPSNVKTVLLVNTICFFDVFIMCFLRFLM